MDALQQSQEMQMVIYNTILDGIENSDAPDAVKEYVRKFRNSQQAEKLIESWNYKGETQ
jgi:hypothetical protein